VKKVTIEDLAMMTQKGFADTASKRDLNSFRSEVKKEFNDMGIRLDHIENLTLTDHRNLLERLEDKTRVLKTAMKRQ